MQAFATTPTGVKDILVKTIKNWLPTLRLTWPLIVLLVALREYFCPSCQQAHPEHALFYFILTLVVLIADLSLWVAVCVSIYRLFQHQTFGLGQHLLELLKRSPLLLVAVMVYSFFVSLAGFGGYGLGALVFHYAAPDSPVLKIIPLLIGFPMIYVLVLLIFVLPVLILDRLSFWQAFKYGAGIVYHHWFRAFFVYAAMVVFLSCIRQIYLWEHSWPLGGVIAVVLDLLSFLILVPFLANFYVLVLHDLKLRAAQRRLG